MHESLQLWTDVVNGDWFVKTAMIVFLNKVDLFREKIQRVPLTICFPDYQGKPIAIGISSLERLPCLRG